MRTSRLALCAALYGVLLTFNLAFADAGSPKSTGPASGIYDNAKGSPILDLINGAHSTLDMEIYEMDDPQVIAAIRDALNRGVVVHIVKEPVPVGGACKVFGDDSKFDFLGEAPKSKSGDGAADCEDQQQLVEDVKSAGGKYVPFTKPDLCGGDGTKSCLEHGKIAIADSRIALVSSGNFNTTNLCDLDYSPKTCNRDYSYISFDPAIVKTLSAVVEKDIVGESYNPASVMLPGTENKLTIGPNSLEPLVAYIKTARSKIQLENQYLKEPQLNAALVAAAKRGVKVQVMVASACSFGKPKASEVKKLTVIFKKFDDAGIDTLMFNKNMSINGKNGYLHAKSIVIDGKSAWMGSVNGSTQAETLNREFGIFFDDADDVQKLSSIMAADFTNKDAETWQESLDCAEKERSP